MKLTWLSIQAALLALVIPFYAYGTTAQLIPVSGDQKTPACSQHYNETTSFTWRFSTRGISQKELWDRIDRKLVFIEKTAHQLGITKLRLTNKSYTMSPISDGDSGNIDEMPVYQLSGDVNYVLEGAASALRLAEALAKEKIRVTTYLNSQAADDCE